MPRSGPDRGLRLVQPLAGDEGLCSVVFSLTVYSFSWGVGSAPHRAVLVHGQAPISGDGVIPLTDRWFRNVRSCRRSRRHPAELTSAGAATNSSAAAMRRAARCRVTDSSAPSLVVARSRCKTPAGVPNLSVFDPVTRIAVATT